MKFLIFVWMVLLNLKSCSGRQGIGSVHLMKQLEDVQQFEELILDILIRTVRPFKPPVGSELTPSEFSLTEKSNMPYGWSCQEKHFKCIVFITDETYYDLLKDSLFKAFDVCLTFFVILIEDHEDMLFPPDETKRTLEMAKKQGCQMYVIAVSNGIQVSRLLRFGDRYRLLDTRSRFILMYDRRLFAKSLLYLWKRIVNIIFIRSYSGSIATSGLPMEKSVPWYEITTVPFPSQIQEIIVPRRIGIWKNGKFRPGSKLFADKISNLKNHTLKVVTFQHIPAVTKILAPEFKTVRAAMRSGSMVFTGLEIEILSTISKFMNFQVAIYEPDNADIEQWGKKDTEGQYTGLFGEMVKKHADIALGDLYCISSILEMMDLTIPYNTECLTFLTPESLTDNSWKTLILPFKLDMWIAVIVCLMLSGGTIHALAVFHHKFNVEADVYTKVDLNSFKKKKIMTLPLNKSIQKSNQEDKYKVMKRQFVVNKREGEPEGLYLFGDLINSILYTFGMLLMVSLPKLPTGWSIRILTGWYWLYCLLVAVSYRASMTAILANPAPRVTIDTLEDLVESQLSVGGRGFVNRDFFRTSMDPLGLKLGSKFEMVNDTDLAIDRVAGGEFAFYENTNFLKHGSVKRQLRLQMLKSNYSFGRSQTSGGFAWDTSLDNLWSNSKRYFWGVSKDNSWDDSRGMVEGNSWSSSKSAIRGHSKTKFWRSLNGIFSNNHKDNSKYNSRVGTQDDSRDNWKGNSGDNSKDISKDNSKDNPKDNSGDNSKDNSGENSKHNSRANSSDTSEKNRNLHILSKCVINMPISLGLQKNSPIKPRVDQLLRRTLEAGLIKKWLDDVMQKTLNTEVVNDVESTKAVMNMQKLFGAVIQLLVGFSISFVVLLGELVYFHLYVKRHPNYNKFSRRIVRAKEA